MTKAVAVATIADPDERQALAVADAKLRQAKRPARAALTLENTADGGIKISNPHADGPGWSAHVNETFGTASPDFAHQAFSRLMGVVRSGRGAVGQEASNAALALMGAVAPADELEASIGEQITAAHVLSMDLMARANQSDTIQKMQAYTTMATKVSRTMAAHVETLAKLRCGGRQRIEVRYVYVNGNAVIGDGAQAVFGAPGAHGGGGLCGKAGQPLDPVAAFAGGALEGGSSMRSEDAILHGLPRPGDQRPQALQVSRWDEPGSAEGEGERPISARALHARADGGSRPGPRRSGQRGA